MLAVCPKRDRFRVICLCIYYLYQRHFFGNCLEDAKPTKTALPHLSEAALGVRVTRGLRNLPLRWSHSATSRSSSFPPSGGKFPPVSLPRPSMVQAPKVPHLVVFHALSLFPFLSLQCSLILSIEVPKHGFPPHIWT